MPVPFEDVFDAAFQAHGDHPPMVEALDRIVTRVVEEQEAHLKEVKALRSKIHRQRKELRRFNRQERHVRQTLGYAELLTRISKTELLTEKRRIAVCVSEMSQKLTHLIGQHHALKDALQAPVQSEGS